MKFQAQTAEEKEAWIKALNEGISRAKNKVFDEVNACESESPVSLRAGVGNVGETIKVAGF